jgi:hypothetical protein
MTENFVSIKEQFFSDKLPLRARLFNVLAAAGTLVGFFMTVAGLFTGAGAVNIFANLSGTVLAWGLLLYSRRGGRFELCCMISIAAVFLVLFPTHFFTSEGYRGGMPSFFIFAVVFTAFMLDGKAMFVMTGIEMLLYTGLCLFAYLRPDTVTVFPTEKDLLTDTLVSFWVVSAALGAAMFLQFRLYNEQQ